MGSLERRLERLEASTDSQQGYKVPRSVERHLHTLDNHQRRTRGLEELPDLPYIKEDYEDDLTTLHEHIPTMRAGPGWQTDEGKAFLDSWERDVTERIERNEQ